MTITIFSQGGPSRQYEVDVPKPELRELIHRNPLRGKLVGFDRFNAAWQELMTLILEGRAQVGVEGRAYVFESLIPETGEFTLKAT